VDWDAYREAYFVNPQPKPRFRFRGSFGVTLYFKDFDAAVAFYERVLGPPSYVEGEGTRGWPIGAGWLTLLAGRTGNPQSVEITFELETAGEAEALQQAFLAAGATGPAPSDQLMYRPVRSCPVVDPFGLEIMITGPLAGSEGCV
jgi:catechol 2,3-dioxygenase-like lactoylglutathione lyase family enzyme